MRHECCLPKSRFQKKTQVIVMLCYILFKENKNFFFSGIYHHLKLQWITMYCQKCCTHSTSWHICQVWVVGYIEGTCKGVFFWFGVRSDFHEKRSHHFDVLCTVHHPTIYIYINQQDAQNSMIRLYFPLNALHVSDCISPSSGATL